jgi:hypothetical protein
MTPASAEPAAHHPQAPLPQRATRCPECDAPSGAIRRWPDSPGVWRASCSRCRHAWLEASRRTLFDTLFHSGDLVVFAGLAGIAVIGSGILVYALLAPIVGSNDASAFFSRSSSAWLLSCSSASGVSARSRCVSRGCEPEPALAC